MNERTSIHPTTGPGHPARHSLHATDLVLTPGGYRPRANVALAGPEDRIAMRDQQQTGAHTANQTRNRALRTRTRASYGEPHLPGQLKLLRDFLPLPPVAAPTIGFAEGWIAFTGWLNDTGKPISQFTAKWVVPPPPAIPADQTIFLFIGIQNNNFILQPVLQWGISAAGGGQFWSIGNWYADGTDARTVHSQLLPVNPDDTLTASITQTVQNGDLFNCTCAFEEHPEINLIRDNIQELSWANVTLETYKVKNCGDYPAAPLCAITDIRILTEGDPDPKTPDWTLRVTENQCGQDVTIPTPGGDTINLHF